MGLAQSHEERDEVVGEKLWPVGGESERGLNDTCHGSSVRWGFRFRRSTHGIGVRERRGGWCLRTAFEASLGRRLPDESRGLCYAVSVGVVCC